ncbi:MAG: VWA domain-containing protein [Sulfolobus sp.]|nr:VWA domain-containing protein [Sulfolobus sp.]
MTVNVSVKLTHAYASSKKTTEVGAVLFINPENKVTISNVHYFIIIDNSPSMLKEGKLQKAIEAANELAKTIPQNNFILIGTFSNDLEILYQGDTGKEISVNVKEHGYTTYLFRAMNKIIELAETSNKPTVVFLITDGEPTDKRNPKDYEKLKKPKNLRIITIGVGRKYNEKILGKISSKFNGVMYNVNQIDDVKQIFKQYAKKEAGGYNAELEAPKEFIPLNFSSPITIPVLDRDYTIYGLLDVPAGKDPYVTTFKLYYDDPVTNDRIATTVNVKLERTSDNNLINSTINENLMDLIKYYRLLNEVLDKEISGKEATRVLNEINELTKKLSSKTIDVKDSKELMSEVTRKLKNED